MIDRLSKRREDEGFTLIELLVVIIIIGILAAIAIPVFLNQRRNAWDAAVQADLRNAATAQETVLTDCGVYTEDVDGGVPGCDATNVASNKSLDEAGFKYSAGTNYDGGTAAITVTANGGDDYCMTATSASGTAFQFDSPGGLTEGSCA